MEVAPNILIGSLIRLHTNQVWATDISYVWTLNGWMYVAVVIDLYSRQVVGWAIDEHMKTSLCINALQMATGGKKTNKRFNPSLDRGKQQYASHYYSQQLKIMGMVQSMSRKGILLG